MQKQNKFKSLSSLKRMRSHDPQTRLDRDMPDARVSSVKEVGDNCPRVAADLQQPDRVALDAAPIPANPPPRRWKWVGRQSASRRLSIAALLPGLAFVSMGRPVPGLICYALQASVVGWLPAALWATYTTHNGQRKQRSLAARLRPN